MHTPLIDLITTCMKIGATAYRANEAVSSGDDDAFTKEVDTLRRQLAAANGHVASVGRWGITTEIEEEVQGAASDCDGR